MTDPDASNADAHRPARPIAGFDGARRRSRLRRGSAVALAAAKVMLGLLPSEVAAAQGVGNPRFTVYTETNAASGNQILHCKKSTAPCSRSPAMPPVARERAPGSVPKAR